MALRALLSSNPISLTHSPSFTHTTLTTPRTPTIHPTTTHPPANTRCTFPMDADTISSIGTSINSLLQSFQTIKTATAEGKPPVKQPAMSISKIVKDVTISLECNPNIFPDPFKAEVFVQISSSDIEVSSQCLLPKLIEGVKMYKKAMEGE